MNHHYSLTGNSARRSGERVLKEMRSVCMYVQQVIAELMVGRKSSNACERSIQNPRPTRTRTCALNTRVHTQHIHFHLQSWEKYHHNAKRNISALHFEIMKIYGKCHTPQIVVQLLIDMSKWSGKESSQASQEEGKKRCIVLQSKPD